LPSGLTTRVIGFSGIRNSSMRRCCRSRPSGTGVTTTQWTTTGTTRKVPMLVPL
jgi:hypothetical protein